MWILNARVIGHAELNDTDLIHLKFDDANQLVDLQSHLPCGEDTLDLGADFLSLGGVDLQINGALGLPFPELRPDLQSFSQLTKISQLLWQSGVNAYAPTLVTTSVDNFLRALACLAAYESAASDATATIVGAHLEGPCLNPEKRGAHPQQYLQPLTSEVLATVMGDYADQVAIVTLAPELASGPDVIQSLKSGLPPSAVISLGHSLATDQEAALAFAAGASMVTHAFNAMPPLHHRNPGLLATALTTPDVWCGLIADGQHVSPRMMKLLIQASPGQGIFLVSDALSPLGLPDGDYPWDDRTITVTDGTARLPDGTLSGTTRPLLDGVQHLVQWDCCSPETAIALATDAPRRAMGMPRMELGTPLHQFLRWSYHSSRKQLTWERLDHVR